MSSRDSSLRVFVGLGEVLWDVFPDRVCFGGAPANFACSVAALSSRQEVQVVSAVGDDQLGTAAIGEFRQRDVGTTGLQIQSQRTGEVRVQLNEHGVADYTFAEDVAWDHLNWTNESAELAARTDVVCFGSLAQRSEMSRDLIQRFVRAVPASGLRIFDVNLRPPYSHDDAILASLDSANVLKLNDEELPVVAELAGISGSVAERLTGLAAQFELQTIALTRGPDGAVLLHENRLYDSFGVQTETIDTVGAGDAFTASMALGLIGRCNPESIVDTACRVAAFVCSQSGATPPFPDKLRDIAESV